VSADFPQQRKKAMELLQKEEELQNIVQLIGPDALPEKERLILEAAKMIREDFLQQNSFEETDCYTTPKKQYLMLKAILHYYDKAISALAADVPFESIVNAKEKEQISQLKRVPEKEIEAKVNGIIKSLDAALSR